MGKRILEAVAFLRSERLTPFELPPPSLPQGAQERAEALALEIDRNPYGNNLGRVLAATVLGGMATRSLASQAHAGWRASSACRRASRSKPASPRCGRAADDEVDLLCTNCRGPKLSASALSELPRGAHCPSCNIDYDRDFEKNVELSFAPRRGGAAADGTAIFA